MQFFFFLYSIVAIHGPGGNPFRSWTEDKRGSIWIKDFVPDCFPQARIFTFGYKSEASWAHNSIAMVKHAAQDLLVQLQIARDDLVGARWLSPSFVPAPREVEIWS